MAMIRVQCPKSNCRTITEVDEIYIGRTARCRKCGTSFEIKRPALAPDPAAAATAAPTAQMQAETSPVETTAQAPVVAETPADATAAEEHPLAVPEPISQELASLPKSVSEVPAPVLDVAAVVHTRSRTIASPEPTSPPPSASEMEDAVSDTTRKRQRRTRKTRSTETHGESETGEVTE